MIPMNFKASSCAFLAHFDLSGICGIVGLGCIWSSLDCQLHESRDIAWFVSDSILARSQVLLLVFLPSLCAGSEPDAAAAPRAACGGSRAQRGAARRCVSPRAAARVGAGGKRRAQAGGRRGSSAVGRSRGVCACSRDEAGWLGSRSPHLPGCEAEATALSHLCLNG